MAEPEGSRLKRPPDPETIDLNRGVIRMPIWFSALGRSIWVEYPIVREHLAYERALFEQERGEDDQDRSGPALRTP